MSADQLKEFLQHGVQTGGNGSGSIGSGSGSGSGYVSALAGAPPRWLYLHTRVTVDAIARSGSMPGRNSQMEIAAETRSAPCC